MPVNLSIKNVPDELADKLRERARDAHRSLQGELMHILEEAIEEDRPLSIREVRERILSYDVKTGEEAVRMIREDRDAR